MSWANNYIIKLKNGENISFRPRGNSMTPKIKSGELCYLEPITDGTSLEIGDIVLCKVSGQQYLHLISAIRSDSFQISNNHGHINGWTKKKNIFGKLVKKES